MSKKKKKANKKNTQKGKGLKTTQTSKVESSLNTIKQGGHSWRVLPGESPEAFAAFREGLLKKLNPQDSIEQMYAEEAIVDAWRLQRLARFELHQYQHAETLPEGFDWQEASRKMSLLTIRIQRSRDKALQNLREYQAQFMQGKANANKPAATASHGSSTNSQCTTSGVAGQSGSFHQSGENHDYNSHSAVDPE